MDTQVLDAMARGGFEQVIAMHDRRSGLRGFLAVHDTSAGPALGGIRRWTYRDEAQALRDALHLARAMTKKCVLAELPCGGGKIVCFDDPRVDWERAYTHIGELVQGLGGRFHAGPDVGTGERELGWVAGATEHVARPGPEGPGRLPAATAEGVLAGIAAALRHLDGAEDWRRRTVVIQGLGSVGSRLARRLAERGARVIASEADGERAAAVQRELGIEIVPTSVELRLACDVLAPCALGGILHDLSLERLRARAVAGAANNVLARAGHADRLRARGVLYAPDFVISAGALIRGALFLLEGRREPLERIGDRIGGRLAELFRRATHEERSPARVAAEEAEARLRARRREAERRAAPASG